MVDLFLVPYNYGAACTTVAMDLARRPARFRPLLTVKMG